MLIRFSVSNFKNFESKIELDLSKHGNYKFNKDVIKEGIINKGLIYGVNGSGKSNLCLAIFDITRHLTNEMLLPREKYVPYIYCDSDKPYAEFEYEFLFGKTKVIYKYAKKDEASLAWELLTINQREVVSYDFEKAEGFSRLKDTEKLNNFYEESNISRIMYLKTSTILDKNDEECAAFFDFVNFVDNMLLFSSLDSTVYQGFSRGLTYINRAIIKSHKTKEFEAFLKECQIDYDLVEKVNDDDVMDLYCHFDKTGRDVPLRSLASTGTRALGIFFLRYTQLIDRASFVMIDEFDAFYHFELSKTIAKTLRQLDNTQVFLTTHNTDLLSNDLLRPDCYFLIQGGNIKSLNRLTDMDIQECNNLQKMYKAGLFDE